MVKDVARGISAVLCSLICVSCPIIIYRVSETYAETGFDDSYSPWPVYVVDGLFWLAAGATVGLIASLRSWQRWAATIVAVPLLVTTGALAVTGGMWIEGTYF
jgi:hypothetical protein